MNFPNDHDYTLQALIEELSLTERHCRDESYKLCSCLSEKHTYLIAGLASEGMGFAESDEEREFMRELMVRSRKFREDIKAGRIKTLEDYEKVRAWARENRHRLDQRNWGGDYQRFEYAESPLAFVEVVEQINALTGSLSDVEDSHVDEVLTKLAEKHGVPKPRYRFIDKCDPLREAYQVGYDRLELVKTGDGELEVKRTPLTEHDELVFCRGGASPYAISHEFCHHLDRVKKGVTSEESATLCALQETGNKSVKEKNINNLSPSNKSGGNIVSITKRIMDAAPFVAGVWAGEIIDETGMIDTTIGPYTGGFTGLAKAAVGFAPMIYGLTKAKGMAADFLVGVGAPLVVSGLKQQFMPVTPPPESERYVRAGLLAPRALTPYGTPTGMRYGHPTLAVPMIPPRPGVLAPSGLPQALSGKWILGAG